MLIEGHGGLVPTRRKDQAQTLPSVAADERIKADALAVMNPNALSQAREKADVCKAIVSPAIWLSSSAT